MQAIVNVNCRGKCFFVNIVRMTRQSITSKGSHENRSICHMWDWNLSTFTRQPCVEHYLLHVVQLRHSFSCISIRLLLFKRNLLPLTLSIRILVLNESLHLHSAQISLVSSLLSLFLSLNHPCLPCNSLV